MTIIRACGANPTRRNTTCRPLPTQPPPPLPPPLPAALVFDACNVGVVLRAVLFVQAVVATASMFGADSPLQWLQGMALLTGACLPGTLVWLVAACLLKHPLQRLPASGQYAAGVLLGMAAGLYACAMLHLAGGTSAPGWPAPCPADCWQPCWSQPWCCAHAATPADTQARLAELQSRIRPHFLFNTLNSAIALVRAEPAKAEALLEDLSDLFRYALAEPHSTTTLAEEIELAQRYLAIEQVRFGERLQVRWQLDPAAHGALLPPLLLQPLVENAIRHGVEPSARGGKLQVRTERRGDLVEVRITNTLPSGSIPPAQPARAATALRWPMCAPGCRCCDLQAHLTARTLNGHFVVRISLPLAPPASQPTKALSKKKHHAHPDR